MNWPELEEEREGSGLVKRDKPILVVLGNPPYNAFAGRSPKEEEGLVEDYKGVYFTTPPIKGKSKKKGVKAKRLRHYRLSDPPSKGGWGIKKFNLDDLYIRFFRLAERRIGEKTGKGVVSFISNHSWVGDSSFVVMREHLLQSFDKFWIENMHGNRKISEYAPDGKTSETVFAISGFSPGIQQGVAISLWVKTGKEVPLDQKRVLFRDDLNDAKASTRRTNLLASLNDPKIEEHYEEVHPTKSTRYSFRPSEISRDYQNWPRLIDLSAAPPSNGLMEKRGSALIGIDKNNLEARMKKYYDPKEDWDALQALETGLTKDAARFNARKARGKVIGIEKYQADHLRRYALRPFDSRWSYYSAVRPLWNEPRPALWAQQWKGNGFLMSRPAAASSPEGVPLYFTTLLGDNDFLRGHAYYLPLRLKSNPEQNAKKRKVKEALGQTTLGYGADQAEVTISANLSGPALTYIAALGISDVDADEDLASAIWMHALAMGYSPAYLAENADGVRQDWPRIPLPSTKDALSPSAELGRKIAALLDTEIQVVGVTSGAVNLALKSIGKISKVSGALVPEQDLKLPPDGVMLAKPASLCPAKGSSSHVNIRLRSARPSKLGLSTLA